MSPNGRSAGRRIGGLLFWFLNAGEIYTTFAVLGISGYAWAYGAPAYLALTSVSLAATLGYWLMPKIWAAGRERGLLTQADFFADHYQSRLLGVVVALAGIAALVIYVQIQIVALGLVVRLTLGPGGGAGAGGADCGGGDAGVRVHRRACAPRRLRRRSRTC